MAQEAPSVSVVVPTYNEAANLGELTRRLFAATKDFGEVELLFADDESEGTAESEAVVRRLQAEGYAVRMHVRRRGEGRGLSSAVILGFQLAKFDTLVCMDADLQHEPEAVPSIAAPVLAGRAQFAIGSRNVQDGGVGFDWSLRRRIISKGATMLAWFLTSSTDPMSGFFCVERHIVDDAKRNGLNARGFKIALEIMVRAKCRTVEDVPITFRDRHAGESKLTAKQNIEYLKQLVSLYIFLYTPLLVAGFMALLALGAAYFLLLFFS